ncbi:DUF1659 domain-containing protein [Neobacillus sedimentimangrovi]|uniref:DUF1659 domain-containing protein n=2 Tax=Neobacillus TaxID=2675232 RepID=A0A6B3TT24_9BACI|nr:MULTISPECIES: DUF1659 domain-containing protein [Neobacillus]MCD4838355.1 DUF1659 domain-containing protein [Neobacillus sedimentimangrovi]NEX79638.1 DUF1659 domain-containing protein [Neobacillus thermocopriae]
MAQSLLVGTKLKMVFQTGIDDDGKPILRTKTFSNVRKEASADQLFQAANALAVLCNDPLNTLERTDSSEIIA